MVIYSYHVSRREKKIPYVLTLNGSSLTLWTHLGLGRDNTHTGIMLDQRFRNFNAH